MNDEQVYCVLDYETYSEVDLKKVGAYEYSLHPSTEILCVAWRTGTRTELRTTKIKSASQNGGAFQNLKEILNRKDLVFVSHNALFEKVITENVLGVKVNPAQWLCTATQAAALALPRNLEGAANALNLPVKKDMDGRRLVLKMCKPKKASKKDPSTRHLTPALMQRLVEYCERDVETEVELFLRTPPLTPKEREIWLLDQKINLRGFAVDRPLVDIILEMIEEETIEINRKTAALGYPGLYSATQTAKVMDFLNDHGVFIDNLRKDTVQETLKNVYGPAQEILQHRVAISKTSTAKYQAFEMRSRSDGRLRDILMYHAASTGRWGGLGVQPQNLPRAKIKDTDAAAEVLAQGDLEFVRMMYGNPMQTFSDCIRSMIIAPPDKVLDVADYAAIETRVLFWVAKHESGLKAFREGRDLYVEQAAKVFGKPPEKIGKDSFERFVGKGLILGCGYGMGWERFSETCRSQGQTVDEDLAKTAVNSYRSTHYPVVQLWDFISRAAIAAVENLGKRYVINRTAWEVKYGFLWCELPSGRRLAYAKPRVNYETPKWGGHQKIPVLYYWCVDPLTKQWTEIKNWGGGLVENVVQAIARDLMAEAMLRIENAGPWQIVLSVHDELIAERYDRDPRIAAVNNKDFCRLMEKLPDWAEGCPVTVTGWEGKRYKK